VILVMMSALCSGLLDNMTFYFQRGLAIQFQAQVLKKVHKQKTRTNREGNIGYSSSGGSRILIRGGQLSDCNGLSGSNSLTNRVLNKKN
jgi:hypothetical protein